jgi:cytochrome P450
MAVTSDTETTTRRYIDNLHEYSILYIQRVSNPLLWWQSLYNLTKAGKRMKSCIESMKTFTENIIRKRIQDTLKTNNCILDLILESFELNEARHEVDTLIFAGHDTVSTQRRPPIGFKLNCIGIKSRIMMFVLLEVS